ncbi:MAG TPA: hypothetical protein VN328_04095 [Thermodesulfovibrionales bacterium]|nr:hypothetical protein [Thermodesulfovibrionales bacterium]
MIRMTRYLSATLVSSVLLVWSTSALSVEVDRHDNCELLGCTKEATCRDIFGYHPMGLAVDIGGANHKPLCSFGTYYDPDNDIVKGDTDNIVSALHKNLQKTSATEGAAVFSPLGAYYFLEGEWNKLPPLFKKILYKNGDGNQNCVFHYHVENQTKPPVVLLKLGGLWLGDRMQKVFDQYGKATEVRKDRDGFITYIFSLDKEKQAYLVVESVPYDKEYIWSVQISGKDRIPLKGLMGVGIGSAEGQLITTFGTPSTKSSLKDIPGEFLDYKDRNYSFELDAQKRIRSIKIILPRSFLKYLTN